MNTKRTGLDPEYVGLVCFAEQVRFNHRRERWWHEVQMQVKIRLQNWAGERPGGDALADVVCDVAEIIAAEAVVIASPYRGSWPSRTGEDLVRWSARAWRRRHLRELGRDLRRCVTR